MPALWTPLSAQPKVSREHRNGTREWEAHVKSMCHWSGPIIDHWNPELQQIDTNLRLVQAMPNAMAAGVIAGFYHLVRLNETAPMWVQPLVGPGMSFVEPSSQMLDALRMCDLQNPRVVADRHREDELAAKRKAKADQVAHEDRTDESLERWQASTRTQVLMSSDVAWSQNNSANARRARGEKRKG